MEPYRPTESVPSIKLCRIIKPRLSFGGKAMGNLIVRLAKLRVFFGLSLCSESSEMGMFFVTALYVRRFFSELLTKGKLFTENVARRDILDFFRKVSIHSTIDAQGVNMI